MTYATMIFEDTTLLALNAKINGWLSDKKPKSVVNVAINATNVKLMAVILYEK